MQNLVGGIFLALLCSQAFAEPKLLDRVVALVDDDVVLSSELIRRVNSITEQIKGRNQKVPEYEQLREQVLERLVSESLQLQAAKRAGVRISDAELDATIEKIGQENNISVTNMREQTVKQGTPWAIYREDLRKEIMISRTRSGFVSRRIQISDKEIDNLLVQIDQEGQNRIQYSLGHILLPLTESASPEEIEKVRGMASRLISELRSGANFEEYAITYSSGQNALNGGNLGSRSLAQMPTLFAGIVKNMKAGDISEALRSGSGLHILHLIDVKGGFAAQSIAQTHVRHILISPNVITDEKAAFEKLQLVRQRITEGEKFEDLAVEFSDDKNSGSLGGDLNWINPAEFLPEFVKAMELLAINELSEPVKSQAGWHLIEVLGRRDQDQTEEIKRDRAFRILQSRKFEEEALVWLSELKELAYIKIIEEE